MPRPGTTQELIRLWLREAQSAGATHLLVVCDTLDWDDYPVEVMPSQDVRTVYESYHQKNMQKVMEVYNLGLDIEAQLKQQRALNF